MLTFQELELLPALQRALNDIGFEQPTEIQSQAIPALLTYPQDFIGLAKTGTGKTAAFGLSLLNQINIKDQHVQGVIIAPTRELVQQITKELQNFGKYLKGLQITAVYGGASIVGQMKEIRKEKPQIIVASPGRLIDLSARGVVKLDKISTVILDEADEMLNMGFQEDIDKILAYTPEDKQTWLFSATMPKAIRKISQAYMKNPIEVMIKSDQKINENIHHQFLIVNKRDKLEALKRIIEVNPDMYGLVFCRTRRDTQEVSDLLNQEGCATEAIHGELSQAQRDSVMKRFRTKRNTVLLATDVAARGIDIDDLTHVIHLELPDTHEYYTHRSGRTARAGKTGISLSIVTPADRRKITFLERALRIKMEQIKVPAHVEVVDLRINSWLDKLKAEPIDQKALQYYNSSLEIFEDLSREELILKLLSREIGKIKDRTGRDINHNTDARSSRESRSSGKKRDKRERGQSRRESKPRSGSKGDFRNIFINIGKMDMHKGELVNILCKESGLTKGDLGEIYMQKRHTVFELDNRYAKDLRKYFKSFKHNGRPVRINFD